jgi:hypothetical protein
MARKELKVKNWKTPKVFWRIYIKGLDDFELKLATLEEFWDDIEECDMCEPDLGLDFHAYYNWLYGEGMWEVVGEEKIEIWNSKELKDRISCHRWKGFYEQYGDGSCIGIPKEKDEYVVM